MPQPLPHRPGSPNTSDGTTSRRKKNCAEQTRLAVIPGAGVDVDSISVGTDVPTGTGVRNAPFAVSQDACERCKAEKNWSGQMA